MKKTAAFAVMMFLGCAAAAHASTLDVTLGNTNNSVSFSSFPGFNTSNVVLASPGNLTLNNNALLISSPPLSVTNDYQEPSVFSLNGNNYLAVEGTGANPGLATFTLSSGLNELGFTWGTIDTYNTLIVTDSTGHTFNLSGTSVLNQLSIPLSQSGAGGSQTDIKFFDPFGSIVNATFGTTQNSFEVANFYQGQSSVPLPSSLVLFMLALLGLGIVAYRRQRKA